MNRRGVVMSVTCKMQVRSIEDRLNGKEVRLYAVYSADPDSPNYSWSKATPDGELRLYITNEAAFSQFEPDKAYFVEFKPAD
jgi:hypothetical protein